MPSSNRQNVHGTHPCARPASHRLWMENGCASNPGRSQNQASSAVTAGAACASGWPSSCRRHCRPITCRSRACMANKERVRGIMQGASQLDALVVAIQRQLEPSSPLKRTPQAQPRSSTGASQRMGCKWAWHPSLLFKIQAGAQSARSPAAQRNKRISLAPSMTARSARLQGLHSTAQAPAAPAPAASGHCAACSPSQRRSSALYPLRVPTFQKDVSLRCKCLSSGDSRQGGGAHLLAGSPACMLSRCMTQSLQAPRPAPAQHLHLLRCGL